MERDVKIYFKVDGIEQYITSLDELQDVLQEVEGATEDATKATKELQEQAEDFDKFQQKLDTIEGGVKVLAGSFQALAGAAGLLGLEDNEFFKELEENVVSVIALGEGAKNMAEGVRLLAQNQKLATAAQRAFNLVANANPYVLLATAVITLTGAIAAYVAFMDDEAIPTEEELAQQREKNRKAVEDAEAQEKLAKEAEDKRIGTLQKLKDELDRVRSAEEKKNETTLDGAIATNEALLAEQQKALDTTNTLIEAMQFRTDATEESLQSLIDQGLNLTKEEQDLYDLYQQRNQQQELLTQTSDQLNEAYIRRNQIIYDQNLVETEQIDRMDKMATGLERINNELDKTIEKRGLIINQGGNVFQPMQDDLDDFATQYFKAFNQFAEEPEVWRDLLVRDTTAAFGFMSDIATIFTKDEELRARRQFNINKALSLSNAVINTAAGITDALAKDGVAPGSRFVSAALVAASGAAQIATILRQQYEGGQQDVNPQTQGGFNPNAAINYNFGQDAGQEIQPGQLSTGQEPEPIQAYVLVSDVNNAQQANNQIENLARL